MKMEIVGKMTLFCRFRNAGPDGAHERSLGIHRVRLCTGGVWREGVVDDYLPCAGKVCSDVPFSFVFFKTFPIFSKIIVRRASAFSPSLCT